MLQFVSMLINNFGPYKGENEIDFTDKNGVTIFWGDNGRGKTTLLNAFRYALFGTVQRRHGKLTIFKEMENYESRGEGIYGFSISIKMKNGEDLYLLTRSFKPREGIAEPRTDSDYEKRCFLKKNGSLLSPDQRDHALNMLMPEQVSRFFLFDGELLQEYEGLVIDGENSGERIKEAIEKILGVPVLQNATVDLENLKSNIERNAIRVAQKNNRTRLLASQVSGIEEEIANHVREIDDLNEKKNKTINEYNRISDEVKKTEQIRTLFIQKDEKQSELTRLVKNEDDVLRKIVNTTSVCWTGMLSGRINDVTSSLSMAISGLEKKKQTRFIADKFIEEMRTACKDKRCPVCSQSIEGNVLESLLNHIRDSESKFSGLTDEESETLILLQGQIASLKRLSVTDEKQTLQAYEQQLAELRISRTNLQQEISKISNQIENYEQENGAASEAITLTQRLVQLESKISNINDAMIEEKRKRDELIQKKTQLHEQISRSAVDGELIAASKKQELCNHVYDIFSLGVDTYSRRLKENVERDATELFVQIANDKDYVGLRINDNYGLNIVLRDGTVVPGRSAGYEHVVALSLIGALHKNAPLQGPIIMDSPFGRLDPTHKRNIVGALPGMANQVFLLVYTNEIDEQLTRESLGSALVSEKHLVRDTAMHTRIE